MSAAAPPTRRVNRGRGHSYTLDGEPAPGVTTVLGDGYPKPALINWAANVTAGFAVDHWDELAEMAVSDRLRRLERARWDELTSAGERGTDVHLLAHRLSAGEEVDVPEALQGHVDAYLKFTEDWQPKELLVEAIIINRQHRYMGTLDTIADLADKKRWLLDFKTSAKGVFLDHVLQLAAYRYAQTYIGPDGSEQDLPDVDRVGVVWLRADGYDLVPVKADESTFRTFLYVQQVARFTRAQFEDFILEPLRPPEVAA